MYTRRSDPTFNILTIVGFALSIAAFTIVWHIDAALAQIETETEGTTMLIFPELTGRNINGVVFTLPADFAGEYNIVMLAFDQRHQAAVNTWIPALRDLEDDNPVVRIYEVPTLPEYNWITRRQVDYFMSAGIPDPLTR
ncbi:MAG: hypothetical protein AAF125_14145, partial [Chloroflexota bacterium]